MKKGLLNNLFIVSLAVIFTCGCSTSGEKKEEVDLNGIFSQFSGEYYALNPLAATQNNVHDYNDQLGY
jgi:hypothetical protein